MNYLCIYSKAPIPGRTKSRLAQDMGNAFAAGLAKSMLLDLCEIAAGIDSVTTQIWHTPDSDRNEFDANIGEKLTFHKQVGRDLGARLRHTFVNLLNRGTSSNSVVIIGSDCITVNQRILRSIFLDLRTHSVAIQPSEDGGYVMIGKSSNHPEIFDDVAWGTNSVYQSTITKLKKRQIKFKAYKAGFDVDTSNDLEKLKNFITKEDQPHTYAWLLKHRLI